LARSPPVATSAAHATSTLTPLRSTCGARETPQAAARLYVRITPPLFNGNTVRSFSKHGQLSAAQGSSTTVSRSGIRLIQHFVSSAHGLVRRTALNWLFPYPLCSALTHYSIGEEHAPARPRHSRTRCPPQTRPPPQAWARRTLRSSRPAASTCVVAIADRSAWCFLTHANKGANGHTGRPLRPHWTLPCPDNGRQQRRFGRSIGTHFPFTLPCLSHRSASLVNELLSPAACWVTVERHLRPPPRWRRLRRLHPAP
jgi:hypothetical protein